MRKLFHLNKTRQIDLKIEEFVIVAVVVEISLMLMEVAHKGFHCQQKGLRP